MKKYNYLLHILKVIFMKHYWCYRLYEKHGSQLLFPHLDYQLQGPNCLLCLLWFPPEWSSAERPSGDFSPANVAAIATMLQMTWSWGCASVG